MKAKFKNAYPNVDKATGLQKKDSNGVGKMVSVYELSGTVAELEQFVTDQGDRCKFSENGKPLLFTTTPSVEVGNVNKSTKTGMYYIDNSELSRIAAQVSHFGGNFGNVLAQDYLNRTRTNSGTSVAAVAAAAPVAAVQVETEDLGQS